MSDAILVPDYKGHDIYIQEPSDERTEPYATIHYKAWRADDPSKYVLAQSFGDVLAKMRLLIDLDIANQRIAQLEREIAAYKDMLTG